MATELQVIASLLEGTFDPVRNKEGMRTLLDILQLEAK